MSLPAGTNYDLATVSNPSGALSDFTLIIDLSNCSADFKSGWNTDSNGYGRAAKSDGTELACDWIDLDHSAGTGLVRVKWSGTLSSSGTQQLRLYPPNTDNAQYAHDDTYGSDNAYDDYWEGYWPNGGGNDRTVNSRDATAFGGVSVGSATGKIGDATDFDGNDDYTEASYSPAASTDHTWMIWANADTVRQQWFFCAETAASGWGIGSWNIDGIFRVYSGSDGTRWIGTNDDCTASWQHWAAKYDASIGIDSVLRDGSELSPNLDNSTTPITSATKIRIGGQISTYWSRFDGLLQESQVHSTMRSDDWIAHEHDQTNDNSTFWSTWTWQGSGGTTTIPVFIHHYRQQGIM